MRKKYIVNAVFGVVLLLLAGLIIYIRFQKPEEMRTVMEVNGQDVVREEYQLILQRLRAQVKSGYSTEEANRKDFWTGRIDGSTPLEEIMGLAEEELIRDKVIASMAEARGIRADADYESLKESMEQENASRSRKEASGEVNYGLITYTEEAYYQYFYTELESELTEALKKEHTITDKELESAYNENLESYRYENKVNVLAAETKAENTEILRHAAEAMESGMEKEELAETFPDISFYELEMNSLDTQEGKSGVYGLRWMLAAGMQAGEISEPFAAGQNMLVMKCLEREEDGYLPLKDVKGVLESQIKTEAAKQEIRAEVQKAEVKKKDGKLEAAAKEVLVEQDTWGCR